MLRDKSLIPLSHQHQHALALCVRIDRARPIAPADLEAWQAEIERQFAEEIKVHFFAEEKVLFPAARQFPALVALIDELLAEHALLRAWFAQAETRSMAAEDVAHFARQLSEHIRREERQLFEQVQELMTAGELAVLGQKLDGALQEAVHSCGILHRTGKSAKQK